MLLLLVDGPGLSLAINPESANPTELIPIHPLIELAVTPRRMHARADGHALGHRPSAGDVKLSRLYRRDRVRRATQDRWPHRHCRKQWSVGRADSWRPSDNRLVSRYEVCSFHLHVFREGCLLQGRGGMVPKLALATCPEGLGLVRERVRILVRDHALYPETAIATPYPPVFLQENRNRRHCKQWRDWGKGEAVSAPVGLGG
jgi:hypothetical protein